MKNLVGYESYCHPRLKHEGSKYALKNKSTGNWFSHFKADEDLFEQKGIYENDENERCESDRRRRKYKRQDEEITWYNHEENRDFKPPKKERLRSEEALNLKKKMDAESQNDDGKLEVFVRGGVHREEVVNNKKKIQGKQKRPVWFNHPDKEDVHVEREYFEDELIQAPKTRLTTENAIEYKDRNVAGSDFVRRTEEFDKQKMVDDGWRPESRVGLHPRCESECWFHHKEDVDGKTEHIARKWPSKSAQETYLKSQGETMRDVFQSEAASQNNILKKAAIIDNKGHSYHLARPFKEHFLNQIHMQNSEGMMKMVLNQNENSSFKEPINYARTVKPEARVSSEKHKGTLMAECMSGYAERASKSFECKAARVKMEILAKHRGGDMALAINGQLSGSNKNGPLRAIKPEGSSNALKARGTLKNNLQTTSQHEVLKSQPRLRSAEAKAIARKYYHGSVDNLIFWYAKFCVCVLFESEFLSDFIFETFEKNKK